MALLRKDFDSITKSLNKVRNDLETLASQQEVKRERANAKIAELTTEAEKCDKECCRARKVSGNLSKLLDA